MRIFNIIWGLATGGGIDKCFLTYDSLATEDPSINVISICINPLNLNTNTQRLTERGIRLINIKNRLDFSWLTKLSALIEIEKPDILFAHGFNGAIMMAMLRLIKRVQTPIVCTYHGVYHPPTLFKKPLKPIYDGLSILTYRHIASHTICVENKSLEFLKRKGVKKISTVHNGIPDIIYTPKTAEMGKTPNIVTASRITEVKGLTYLIKALEILKTRNVPFHYDMIGEGALLNTLMEEAGSIGLNEDDISFRGYRNDIPDWLARCDIFVVPSLSECHSIAILEAMRSGCAIIATDVGGNSESLTHMKEGILIQPKDPQSLADSIQYLIDNPDMRTALASNARKRFENEFTERAMKRGIINVLKSI